MNALLLKLAQGIHMAYAPFAEAPCAGTLQRVFYFPVLITASHGASESFDCDPLPGMVDSEHLEAALRVPGLPAAEPHWCGSIQEHGSSI